MLDWADQMDDDTFEEQQQGEEVFIKPKTTLKRKRKRTTYTKRVYITDKRETDAGTWIYVEKRFPKRQTREYFKRKMNE